MSLLYSVCYSESMKDELHQNLNYTPCSEATQRPQSLSGQTGTKCYLQALSPSKYLPFCWGQGSRAKEILFCSTPFLAPQPNSSMEILAGSTGAWAAWTVAWGTQPELPSCCWKGLQVTLSSTGPLWFHKTLTRTVKTGAISRRLLLIHKSFD